MNLVGVENTNWIRKFDVEKNNVNSWNSLYTKTL